MEFGIYSFGDVHPDPLGGPTVSPEKQLANTIERVRLADDAGLDYFGVGEHHRPDYAISAPATVLAAAASVTSRIRLGSAVTVLSTEDPVRVFQQFATIDLLSSGRAEILAGRGSFLESFPLFGANLDDYDTLFSEKLDLLLLLNNLGDDRADDTARDAVEEKFPTAALAQLEFDTDRWAAVKAGGARITRLVRPRDLDPSLGPEIDG